MVENTKSRVYSFERKYQCHHKWKSEKEKQSRIIKRYSMRNQCKQNSFKINRHIFELLLPNPSFEPKDVAQPTKISLEWKNSCYNISACLHVIFLFRTNYIKSRSFLISNMIIRFYKR